MSRIPLMPEVKDPDEIRAYVIDWSDHLGSDAISTSAWTVVSGSVSVSGSPTNTTTTATVKLTGGTIGETVELLNRITTAGGETLDQSIRVRVRKR